MTSNNNVFQIKDQAQIDVIFRLTKKEQQNIYKSIGWHIKVMRAKRGWTQSDLGKKLSVTAQQVQKHEKGTTNMYVHTLITLSKIFKTPIAVLLSDPDCSEDNYIPREYFVRENETKDPNADK